MLKHFFVADNGALYDTRLPAWTAKPIRKQYSWSCQTIRTTVDFKSTLRAGPYAWPGGYPMFLCTNDGAALCFKCARKEARNIIDSIQSKAHDGWRVVACDINYEDSELYCDHCSQQIESVYEPD